MAKPTIIPTWDTDETNVTEPDAAHKLDGWLAPAGVPEKPPFQYYNFWQHNVYTWLNEINIKGILGYDAITDYVASLSYAVGSDGILYQCIIANGPATSVVNPVGDVTGTWFAPTLNPPLPLLHKEGMTLSFGGVTQLDIDEGEARDATNAEDIRLTTAAFNKTLSAFVAGSGNGSLDTGSIATSTWYNVFIIKNITSAAVDVLISASMSPTMPSGYTVRRWIGAILTDGSSQITEFTQEGGEFLWDVVPTLDIDIATFGTVATLFAVTVPDNIIIHAIVNIRVEKALGTQYYFYSPGISDQAASPSASPLGQFQTGANVNNALGQLTIRTNTNQEIKGVTDRASCDLKIATVGWITNFRI